MQAQPENPFAIGDRVAHGKYGDGTVTEIELGTCTVKFDKAGERRIATAFLEAANDNEPEIVLPSVTPVELRGTASLPRIEWLYPNARVRKFVSGLFSPGGGGKSSLLVAEALDMASGKDILGLGHKSKLRVWYISTEDPEDLVRRQFETAAALHRITNADIGGRLQYSEGRDNDFIVASDDRRAGFTVHRPILDGILARAHEFKPDAIIVDPFVSTHSVAENDNNSIQRVATLWVQIADQLNCSVDLAHHVVKSDGPVTANSGRGGGALKDKARIVRVINHPTAEQAKKFSFSEDEARSHIRVHVDKGNLAKTGSGAWFQIVSVPLGNGDGLTRPQEHAPAIARWFPPDADPAEVAAAKVASLGDALDSILIGIANRECRYDWQSREWVGHELAYVLGVDAAGKKLTDEKRQIGELVDALITTGYLEKYPVRDAVARRSVDMVRVKKN